MISMPVEMYTDGSSLHNPGSAGLGWIIRYRDDSNPDSMPEEHTMEGSQGFRLSTNNRMELMAFIRGAQKFIEEHDSGLFKNVTQLNVFSDSEYLVKGITQNWVAKWEKNNWMTSGFGGKKPRPVTNKDLWEQITQIQNTLKQKTVNLALTHVMGHSGHEWNEKADQLATTAASEFAVEVDTVYETTTNEKNNEKNKKRD